MSFIAKLATPEVAQNLLDGLSFMLITPEIAGPERIGRVAAGIRWLLGPMVRWFDRAMDTTTKFGLAILFALCGLSIVAVVLQPLAKLGFFPETTVKAGLTVALWIVAVPTVVFSFGTMAMLYVGLIHSFATNVVLRRVALVLGIAAFFASRAVGVWDKWPSP